MPSRDRASGSSKASPKVTSRNASGGTLASLAAELGVSRTTVSNAYNHPEELSPKLREKILATAKKLGYPGPDPTARQLRQGRTGAIGVLLTDSLTYAFEDRASVDFLAGLAAALGSAATPAAPGYALTLVPIAPGTENLAAIQQAAVDGFVLYSVSESDPHALAARNRGLPLVICDQPKTVEELPFIGINDRASIAPAAQALVQAGHRRIGMLSIRLDRLPHDGPISSGRVAHASHHVQRDRILGALDVFAGAGLSPETIPAVERHLNTPYHARSAAAELLDAHPDLTAVLCTTDTMALATLEVARERGLSVPGDLSVTGFDGIEAALDRGLTTVIQPNRAKGAAAGRMMISQLGESARRSRGRSGARAQAKYDSAVRTTEVERVLLPTEFSPGATVGPARGGR